MRLLAVILLLMSHCGCQNAQSQLPKDASSQIIESAILWRAEIYQDTWEPIALKKLLEDTGRFQVAGSFYEVKKETTVFGANALYIGILGIDLIPGPNATVEGRPKKIAANITNAYGITFIKTHGEYKAELKEDVVLVVAAHPSMSNTTMIIGAYLGP